MRKTIRKRRIEFKTDYKKRINLLKSEKPRIIFRKTNKYIIAQYVISEEGRDKVIIGTSSKELMNNNWSEEFKGSLKSIPASYLTGILIGKKIISKKLDQNVIVDIGMIKPIHKTKPFAFIKGLNDSGLKIKCNEKTFPGEDRISGKLLKKDFSSIFKKIKIK